MREHTSIAANLLQGAYVYRIIFHKAQSRIPMGAWYSFQNFIVVLANENV